MRSLGVACITLAASTSCVSTVRPPEHVADPVAVHLVSSGRHAGLLLPHGEGELVEFGYGSWNWYALGRDEWWRAPMTVLFPNAGTLGRRLVREPERGVAGELSTILVSRDAALQLVSRLQAEFRAGGEAHYNALYDMWFVQHPDRFWMFHDCHDEAAEWLEALGCSVSWSLVRTGLRVAR